jgi:hypothetical protein
VTVLVSASSPEMRCATRFHHDMRRGRGREEARKLPSVESMPSDDVPLAIRDRDFEHGLCDVHGDCRSIHLGLLLVTLMGIS